MHCLPVRGHNRLVHSVVHGGRIIVHHLWWRAVEVQSWWSLVSRVVLHIWLVLILLLLLLSLRPECLGLSARLIPLRLRLGLISRLIILIVVLPWNACWSILILVILRLIAYCWSVVLWQISIRWQCTHVSLRLLTLCALEIQVWWDEGCISSNLSRYNSSCLNKSFLSEVVC